MAAVGHHSSFLGPTPSALAAALARSQESPHWSSSPPAQTPSPAPKGRGAYDRLPGSDYGSFETREATGGPTPFEDAEVVKRHLVQPSSPIDRSGSPLGLSMNEAGQGMNKDEFSSLRLQGGDITRPIYRWTEGDKSQVGAKAKRSRSFHVNRPEPESEVLDIHHIKVPGGFRRNFLRRAGEDPESSVASPPNGPNGTAMSTAAQGRQPPRLLTNNFLEFLTLYGHFAGEELEEDDEVLEPESYSTSGAWDREERHNDQDRDREALEDSALLTPGRRRRKHKYRAASGDASSLGAILLLLKSFVGTGVLFLPRAYLNGGMLFSNLVLLGVALVSFHCFMLLVSTRQKVDGSFGDMGGELYGKPMRAIILSSLVLSQMGFVSAYIVFTAENLQAFILAVSQCKTYIDIRLIGLTQLIIFLPLSLYRDINKLGTIALIADGFILLGLIYLYYYDILTLSEQGGVSDIQAFNPASWTLFIGTAIFTFEGVGLIIPIQESMKKPHKFPHVLAFVMVVITILFISIGTLSYAAYGSATRTVVILNLPQDDKLVNAVQFLYSLAILLSTPLQLFPAIRIMENEMFTRSGKHNPYIKWQKNGFRFFLVVLCALIAWGGAGDLDKFVALVGSFACVPLVYVYPPLLHLRAVAHTRWQKVSDYGLCCLGMVGCIYTTVLTVNQWIEGSTPTAPGYCDP